MKMMEKRLDCGHILCQQFLHHFSTVPRTAEKKDTALWHSTAKSQALAGGSRVSKAEEWAACSLPQWTYGRHEMERQKGCDDAVNCAHWEGDGQQQSEQAW